LGIDIYSIWTYNYSMMIEKETEMSEFKSWEEMTEKEQLECSLWDAYKDAHGVRPRFMNMEVMSVEELKQELERCCDVIMVNEEQRMIAEGNASHDFEIRMQSLLMSGAKTREMALRWVHEAEGSDGDDEYLCFLLGLPYGYFKLAA
jgi:hypothetical protein